MASVPPPPIESMPSAAAGNSATVTVAGAPSVRSSAAEHRPRRIALPGPPPLRDVSFEILPKGALVSIDGGPAEELFMKIKRLPAGTHTFEARVPAPSKCCESLRREEEIKADDGSGAAQRVSLSLKFRDATVSAPAAPPGAQLRCPILRIAGPAADVFPVHMSTLVEQDIVCDLDIPGVRSQRSSVTLRAGEVAEVPWQASK
jgi:hypothetical protein